MSPTDLEMSHDKEVIFIKDKVEVTHWGWVTHIYISKLAIIGSENGLSPDGLSPMLG